MTQHYPASCVEASAWCNVCSKMTPHRVADKRLQFCIPCHARRPVDAKPAPQPAAEQFNLFGGKP